MSRRTKEYDTPSCVYYNRIYDKNYSAETVKLYDNMSCLSRGHKLKFTQVHGLIFKKYIAVLSVYPNKDMATYNSLNHKIYNLCKTFGSPDIFTKEQQSNL